MKIQEIDDAGVMVLAPSGRIDTTTSGAVEEAVRRTVDGGARRLVIDFASVEYISSAGLRVLIEARKRAREWKLADMERGDVRIVNLPQRIKEVFELTGFTSLFQIYDDLVEAVGSF